MGSWEAGWGLEKDGNSYLYRQSSWLKLQTALSELVSLTVLTSGIWVAYLKVAERDLKNPHYKKNSFVTMNVGGCWLDLLW